MSTPTSMQDALDPREEQALRQVILRMRVHGLGVSFGLLCAVGLFAATNILIIEDEALIAMDLQSLVENLGHEVQGIARTRAEAVAIAKNKDLGLILADIQLADGSSGLDAVNDLLNTFEVPVIFITAYPERFLTGMRPEPAFLITKPYQPAMVSAVISQALFFERKAHKTKNRAVG